MTRTPEDDRGRVRDVVVRLRVREQERKRWKAKADRLGISVSEWLRALANRDARM